MENTPITSFRGEHRFLSNFHPSLVTYDGMDFPTVEHAFQAAKTADLVIRLRVANLPTAADAKAAGRALVLRPDWDEIRLAVMEFLLLQKFAKDPLRSKLLATGDRELVEGNWWNDVFWGVCRGVGENNLGKLLMKTRDMLRGRLR
jgi:ribA/ribD-fused uncharacterized protein